MTRLLELAKETLSNVIEYQELTDPPFPNEYFSFGVRTYDSGLCWISNTDTHSLWYKPDGGKWIKLVDRAILIKTFGAMAPILPVMYVGRSMFLVASSVPDSFFYKPCASVQEWSYCSNGTVPSAKTITYLIDGNTGKRIDQSESYAYFGSPDIQMPEEWKEKYEIEIEQKAAGDQRTASP